MLHPSQTVTTPLTLAVTTDSGDGDLQAELRYDPADPLAVSLALGIDCGDPVVWTFARDLLADGLLGPAGLGDITLEPARDLDGPELRITLATDCLATMTAPRDPIVAFLIESFVAVPAGSEMDYVDFEAEVAALLG
jgi:Streptomyces sporulation and cell division protein, SsgA